jgi:FkbM family methyltransferase
MIDTNALLARYKIAPRGVIHVGAHEGEEVQGYLNAGYRRILLVEANPALAQKLTEKFASQPAVTVANVAICDKPGQITLNVTSMDQSSSILPLKLHQELYPSIQVTHTVPVRAQTIDGVLEELNLSPSEFNYLHMDIQGAEYLALKGAEKTLGHIEAINSEVNFAELYAGGALIGQLETLLGQFGFNRVALARPYHPTWGDAFYVRRPLIAMSTLGANGRFANQLFQYLYLRLLADRVGGVVQTRPWPGRALFGLDDQDVLRPIGRWDESEMSSPAGLLDGTLACRREADLVGWFQLHSSQYRPYRDRIRQIFTLVPQFRSAFDRVVRLIGAESRPIIALHLRRGDYGYHQFFRAPVAWYRDWLESVREEYKNPVIYVCSETPSALQPLFEGWSTLSFDQLRGIPPEMAYLIDFYILTRADAVAISNSSFSFFAAMLNDRARHFVRPDLDAGRLIAFDPWNAPVLLMRHLQAGEQEKLDAVDEALTMRLKSMAPASA